MKNTFQSVLFFGLLSLLIIPTSLFAQETAADGQSTEGKDFWVTFLQADQDDNNPLQLQLSISSRTNANVKISNPFTGYTENVTVTAGEMQLVTLYSGNVLANNARSAMTTSKKVCYAVNSETVDTCALHVESDQTISLFATNYKKATFDATNVLPTASLKDEYLIQTFTPSDHGGVGSTQGSHFAIIAAEDNTIVDYCPTVATRALNDSITDATAQYNYYINGGYDESQIPTNIVYWAKYKLGQDTLHTPVLKKGQVFYVWTGKKDNTPGDLSGTYVRARDGKKIAVFQGCPHTNIPYQVKQRDHIFSQAMPTQYWGSTFVLTASQSRPSDIVRIMALNDQTDIFIDGQKVHTIDFSTDTKRYWQFEIGEQGTYAKNGSCYVTTSCPCAVHLFMTSQQYHGDKNSNGDPAMLWINPIEQQIDQATFATYASSNGTTNHYTNIVTDKPQHMTLDGNDISSQFTPVNGSNIYSYARVSLGNTAASHTLKCDNGNFIAHVYGFTANESYAYSAGGATKPLVQYVTINGKIFSADTENDLCGEDTVKFACVPDYEFEKIVWSFGDGTPDSTITDIADSVVPHFYQKAGVYDAKVCIYRSSSNLCAGQSAVSCIPIRVTIGTYQFQIGSPDVSCPNASDPVYKARIPYVNEGKVDLTGSNVTITFDEAAQQAGFKQEDLTIDQINSIFIITIPTTAVSGTNYGIDLKIVSECGGADTTMYFTLPESNDVIDQRFSYVLGLKKEAFEGYELTNFQWYHDSDNAEIEGQNSSVLNLKDNTARYGADLYFRVCFDKRKLDSDVTVHQCACAKELLTNDDDMKFTETSVSGTSAEHGTRIFVNADAEATASWYTIDGSLHSSQTIPAGGGLINVPDERGLYVLRVSADSDRNFKFMVF